jgi:predicted Rossmann fold flavoprotein
VKSKSEKMRNIAIIGGGAAGFFGAIRAAEVARENGIEADIRIFEASSNYLKKVKISGGGRCNVTHFCFDPKVFCQNYPRGSRELLSLFMRFQASDTVEWFRKRDVRLVAEDDGRMFPDSDKSATIIDCFLSEVEKVGVTLVPNTPIQAILKTGESIFSLRVQDKEIFAADAVLIATGSSPAGYRFAEGLGHTISELAPSLFSFNIQSEILKEMSGISFAQVKLKLVIPEVKEVFKQAGPLLITHWGLSGPAVLKLSAWAAREMMHADYKAMLVVNWLGFEKINDALDFINVLKSQNVKSQLGTVTPAGLTKRFWQNFLFVLGFQIEKRWADLSKAEAQRMAEKLFAFEFQITGKNRFKDEFVECGGVSLSEIDFKTMQSRIAPGLFFAGEVLDVDGITGGFNFQNAWSTSWVAGAHLTLPK